MRVLRFNHTFKLGGFFQIYQPWKTAEVTDSMLSAEDFEALVREVKEKMSWWEILDRPNDVLIQGSMHPETLSGAVVGTPPTRNRA